MAEQPLFKSFQEFIHKNHLIERGEKILVSVSGGIDSISLLHLLYDLKERMKLELAIAHFNHQLRGIESDEDEAFVKQAANKFGLECYIERTDTLAASKSKKLSIQEVARNLRYGFIDKLRRSIGYDKIAMAHNSNDNAETMLMNLFRGSGVHGLTGIPVFRKDLSVIRPLLFATRELIVEYASSRNLKYREDSSNAKVDYTRNFVRHKLIPLIKENINPNLTVSLERASAIFNNLEEFINNESSKVLSQIVDSRTDDEMIIKLPVLNRQPAFMQEHILFKLGKDFSGLEIEFGNVKAMLDLIDSETGSYCPVGSGVVLYKDRNKLIFRKQSPHADFIHPISVSKRYEFDTFTFISTEVIQSEFSDNKNVEYVDAERLVTPLFLRNWKDGDWFIPFGMSDRKKISDFLIDEKIPLFKKRAIPILVSDNDVVWVCGERLDDRFKITLNTKKILKLEYIQHK